MYALIINNTVSKYPYTVSQLRKDNPQVSFPKEPPLSLLSEYGVTEVLTVVKPEPSDPVTKNVIEVTPTFVGGRWTQTWEEIDATAEEIADRQRVITNQTHKEAIKSDNFVQTFIQMTPAQVETYINNNTSNLVEARALLVKLGKMVLLMARREFS